MHQVPLNSKVFTLKLYANSHEVKNHRSYIVLLSIQTTLKFDNICLSIEVNKNNKRFKIIFIYSISSLMCPAKGSIQPQMYLVCPAWCSKNLTLNVSSCLPESTTLHTHPPDWFRIFAWPLPKYVKEPFLEVFVWNQPTTPTTPLWVLDSDAQTLASLRLDSNMVRFSTTLRACFLSFARFSFVQDDL